MNPTLSKLINNLKLPKHDRAELDKFLKRDDIQQILNSDETDRLAHRRELIAEKSAIPAKFEKASKEAEKAAIAAAEELKATELLFYAARRASLDASAVLDSFGYQAMLAQKAIDTELLAGADPRIGEYLNEIGSVASRTRVAFESWWEAEERKSDEFYGSRKYIVDVIRTNNDDVVAALTALDDAKNQLQAMQFEALSGAEITDSLRKITESIRPPLKKLKRNPPFLDRFDQVRPPIKDGADSSVEIDAAVV